MFLSIRNLMIVWCPPSRSKARIYSKGVWTTFNFWRKNDGISLDKKREKIRQNKIKKIKISACLRVVIVLFSYKGSWSWKASQYSVRLSVSVDERKQRTRSERNAAKKRAFVWPTFHFHNFTQSFHLSTNEKWWSDVDIVKMFIKAS